MRRLLAGAALAAVATFGSAALPPVAHAAIGEPCWFYTGQRSDTWYIEGSCGELEPNYKMRVAGRFHQHYENYDMTFRTGWTYTDYQRRTIEKSTRWWDMERAWITVCNKAETNCWSTVRTF